MVGMAFWMNIHGCQLHPKIAIYVLKQLKYDSFRLGLYIISVLARVIRLKSKLFLLKKLFKEKKDEYVDFGNSTVKSPLKP